MSVVRSGSTELSGADWFLVTFERMMRAAGQGEHVGLTVLELGEGFDVMALRSAAERLAAASPVVSGRLKKMPFGVPRWQWETGDSVEFPVREHHHGDRWEEIAELNLAADISAPVSFDFIPRDGGAMLLLRWRHSLLDGKGAELFLAEIARLASEPTAEARAESWGPITQRPKGWRVALGESEKFKCHFYKLAEQAIRSLSDARPKAGAARFYIERFSAAESGQIAARAAEVSHGLFHLGWFLAVAMRAHCGVLEVRGKKPESFQASCAVQERKRGARHPIWQNQLSQLFFSLRPDQLDDLVGAAQLLQEQFEEMSRQRLDGAFAVMARAFRHLPTWFLLRILRKSSSGHITSFFFSHTGECLPECNTFCNAPIEHAWHIPTVIQPPGTGIFFSQRTGRVTATFSWREGVLREDEFEALRTQVREDLLGI
jgi:hypothetical protein